MRIIHKNTPKALIIKIASEDNPLHQTENKTPLPKKEKQIST